MRQYLQLLCDFSQYILHDIQDRWNNRLLMDSNTQI